MRDVEFADQALRDAFQNVTNKLPWGHFIKGTVTVVENKTLTIVWAHIPATQFCAQANILKQVFGINMASKRYRRWLNMCRIDHLEFATSCKGRLGTFPLTLYIQLSCFTNNGDPFFSAQFSEFCCQLYYPTPEGGFIQTHLLLRREKCLVSEEAGTKSFATFLTSTRRAFKNLVYSERKRQAKLLLTCLPKVLVVVVDGYVW